MQSAGNNTETGHRTELPSPAHYYPFASGRYKVRPGLSRLGTDCGNGPSDGRVFQLDSGWPHYRAAKLAARAEALSKYLCRSGFSSELEAHLAQWIAQRLQAEYPALFDCRTDEATGGTVLHCRLSGERLLFSKGWRLLETHVAQPLDPPYVSALDALACQLQEDLAVVELDSDGGDRLSVLHLCYPNHWAPGAKIGRAFDAVHEPVPGIERLSRHADAMLAMLTERGPFVRFAWGLATDDRLNHHPEPPAGVDAKQWEGRSFDPAHPVLYLRVERQVTAGLPEQHAFLFTIRTYFEDVTALSRAQRLSLYQAIVSMSPDVLRYKGLAASRDEILRWLRSLDA